jgi:hypothetical protein
VDEAHTALLAEIRRRLDETRADPTITNTDGSNYWGPYVTRAINDREHDGPALVAYIKSVLRKTGDSEGWNALLEADRLDLSFEEMVLNADPPIRGLFDEEDRQIAARLIGDLQQRIKQRVDEAEAAEVEHDRAIVSRVAANRRAQGKPWTAEMEAKMLADRAARRRPGP